MDNDRLKESYRLWWQYLSRSHLYASLCDCQKLKQESSQDSCFASIFANRPFLKNNALHLLKSFFLYNKTFGNIYTTSFDRWFSQNKAYLVSINSHVFPSPDFALQDYLGSILQDMFDFAQLYHSAFNKDPSISEFIPLFLTHLKSIPHYQYIRFSPLEDTGLLKDSFNKHILDSKEKFSQKIIPLKIMACRCRRLIKPVRIGYLKDYLLVYDLYEAGYDFKDILGKHPNLAGGSGSRYNDRLKSVQSFYQKALTIIDNCVLGYFPRLTPLPQELFSISYET